MKKLITIFVLQHFLFLSAVFSQHWESIGPDGGQSSMLATALSDSNIVYNVLHNGSVFSSNNGGSTWESKGWFPMTLYTVSVHPNNPEIVFIGGYNSSNDALNAPLLMSYDGGQNWNPININTLMIKWIAYDLINPEIIYTVGWGDLFRSEDGGSTWYTLPLPNDFGVRGIAVNPDNPSILYCMGASWDFIRSEDGGQTWGSVVDLNGNCQWIEVDPSNPDRIYIATSWGVEVSNDGGLTWSEIDNGVNNNHPWTSWIKVDPSSPNRIYRGNNHGWNTYISHDYGNTWDITDLPAGPMSIVSNQRLLSGSRFGVYSSDLDCENVEFYSSNLHGTDIANIVIGGNTSSLIYASTYDMGILDAKLYMKNVDSDLWQINDFGSGLSELKIHPSNTNILAAGLNIGETGIKISFDSGSTWENRGPNSRILSIAFSNNDSTTLYAGGYDSLYKSTDLGEMWQTIPRLYDYYAVNDINLSDNDSIICIATEFGYDWTWRHAILISFDRGVSWIDRTIPAISTYMIPDDPSIVFSSTYSEFYRSVDYGMTWNLIDLGYNEIAVFAYLKVDGYIFIGTNNGVFYSINKGETWIELNEGLIHKQIFSISYTASPELTLYVGTRSGGVYARPITNLEILDNNTSPQNFSVHQNYPNPFNPITTLRYDLPQRSNVQITIYDLLGRKVTKLVSETQDAGFKSVIWNATNYQGKPVSAGVYLYQIQAGEFVQTKKMVLLK